MNRVCRPSFAALAAAGVILATAGTARAAAKSWNASGNDDWSNASAWSPTGVPGSGDDVTISGGSGRVDVDVAVDVNSITVNGACTRLIRNNSGLTMRIRGDLTLASTSTGGSFRFSAGTTRIGGQLTRSNTNMAIDSNGGTIVFDAASGTKTHTFNGGTVEKVIFNDGLVGYWNMDEDGGGTLTDQSGFGHDGSLNNGTYSNTVFPTLKYTNVSSVSFNGTSSYASIANATDLPSANAAQTISAWVNFAGATSTQSIVALNGSGSALRLGLSGGNVQVIKNSGTLVSVTAPSASAWHHLAYTWDGTTNRLYVDGVVTTTTTAHDTAAVTAAFIGATTTTTNRYSGRLDDVRIYNRALGEGEVKAMAQGKMPGTGVATHAISGAFSSTTNAGDFVIASGTVTGSSAMTVQGSWLNYGGRFTGTGTVSLSSGQNSEVLLTGGQPFSNLTITSTGRYNMYDRLWVPNGTLDVQNGTNFSAGSYVAHVGYLTDGTTGGTGFSASGTIVLDGSSNQSLASRNFSELRIEDPTETGLVAYWKLDEGNGTTLRDWSGNGNTMTLSSSGAYFSGSGPSTISFDDADALTLDGSAGWAGRTSGLTGMPAANAAQSFSAWVKFASTAGVQNMVALVNGGASNGVQIGLRNGNLTAWIWGGVALAQVAAPTDGLWHHVAYTYDGTTDRLYLDGVVTTGTGTAHQTAAPDAVYLGTYNGSAELLNGTLDDVRIYNTGLSAAQVASLAAGRYAGTGGTATVTKSLVQLVIGTTGTGLTVDSGTFDSSTFNVTVSVTATPCMVNAGGLTIGSGIVNCDGGLTIQPRGTLTMATNGGQLQPGVNTNVIINGTLNASNTGASILRDNAGQKYSIQVGTTATATPVLNITGLTIRDLDANGMQVNVNTSAVTTFTRFDNIVFNRGTTGTGSQFLKIYAGQLYLAANGCTFGVGDGAAAIPASAVSLTGNGTADGETRIVFGKSTCATTKTDATTSLCVSNWKTDDDSDGNGIGNTPATNGAVVQFVRGVSTDTAGSIEGLPSAAFDWNTFTYYSTYVAFRDTSGTVDTVYVRDQAGNARYQWNTPSGETIVGTPRWNTTGTSHYLYVALASGKVYRLIDNGSSLVADSSGSWAGANNPFNCGCTIVSPLGLDTSNLYWAGTAGATQAVWTLGQVSRSQPMGSPLTITPTITTSAPAVSTSGSTYLFLGLVGNIVKINASTQVLDSTNTSPGAAAVRGRVLPSFGVARVYAGDDAGTMWALDPANFAGTNKVWSYVIAGDSIQSSPYLDLNTTTVGLYFGTDGGKVVGLNYLTGAALAGFPFVPGTTSDKIRTAMLSQGGLLIVGTTTGKLFFIDRSNGTGPVVTRQYYFGPTQSVSGVSYDTTVSRYMVATSDSSTNDGRLYVIDLVADPTSGTP